MQEGKEVPEVLAVFQTEHKHRLHSTMQVLSATQE
jgi:hypothetical protein